MLVWELKYNGIVLFQHKEKYKVNVDALTRGMVTVFRGRLRLEHGVVIQQIEVPDDSSQANRQA